MGFRTVNGHIIPEAQTINLSTGNNHDLSISSSSININPSADGDVVTGFSSEVGEEGEILDIINIHSAGKVVLRNGDIGSLASNRIYSRTERDVVIPPKGMLRLKWIDDGNGRAGWWVIDGRPSFISSKQVTTSVTNTLTETEIYSAPFPANSTYSGQVFKTHVLGRYSTANGTDTFTARIKIGGTTILSITSDAGNVTDTPLEVVFTVTIRSIGATGTVFTFAGANFNNVNKAVSSVAEASLDTTIAEDISITVQWSAANAGNSISIDQGFLQL